MIPVEDFTGPTISEIQKFIEITDEARKDGEVSNHQSATYPSSNDRRYNIQGRSWDWTSVESGWLELHTWSSSAI